MLEGCLQPSSVPPSQTLSFSHSPDQAVPSSEQNVAELAGAALLGNQANDRVLQLSIKIVQDPTRENAEILTIKENAIARDVIAPQRVVIAEMKIVA